LIAPNGSSWIAASARWDGGLTLEETAETLKVSPDKVKKDLEKG
jgi:DNA-directed RNA polymerase specialized sigma24 family protein